MKAQSKLNPHSLSINSNLKKTVYNERKLAKEASKLRTASLLQIGFNSKNKGRNQPPFVQYAERTKSTNEFTKGFHKISVNPAKETQTPNQTQEDQSNFISSPCSPICKNDLTNTNNNDNNNNTTTKVSHEDNSSEPSLNQFQTPKCKPITHDNSHFNKNHQMHKVSKASSSENRNIFNKVDLPSSPPFSQSKMSISYNSLIKDLSQAVNQLNSDQNDIKCKEIFKLKKFELYISALNQMYQISIDNSQMKLIKIIIDGLNEMFSEDKNTDNTDTQNEQKRHSDSLLKENSSDSNTISNSHSEITYTKKKLPKFSPTIKSQDNSSQFTNTNKIEVIRTKEAAPHRQSESTNNDETLSIDLDSIYFNDKLENLTHSVSYSHIPKLNLGHCFTTYNNGFKHENNNKKKSKIQRSKSKLIGNKEEQQRKKSNCLQRFSLKSNKV